MKKLTVLVSAMCFISLSTYAQTSENSGAETKKVANTKKAPMELKRIPASTSVKLERKTAVPLKNIPVKKEEEVVPVNTSKVEPIK